MMRRSGVLLPERPSVPIPDELRNTLLVPQELADLRGIGDQRDVHKLYSGRQRDPHDENQSKFDRELVRLGLMDKQSFYEARSLKRWSNPVRVVVTSGDRLLKLIYRWNLRTNAGTTWMGYGLMGGGVGTASGHGLHVSGTATASSATTLTTTLTVGDTTSYVGHIIATASSYGYIISHTSTANCVFTVDRWYDTTVTTGAAGTTPGATTTFVIVPGQSPAYWMAMSNDATAPNTTDTVVAGEITTNGLARTRATIAFTPPSGAGTTTNQGTYTEQVTFTCNTASQAFQKSGLLAAQNGGPLVWEAALTATTLQVADQAQTTWTVNF